MADFIYLIVLGTGAYFAGRLIFPELIKAFKNPHIAPKKANKPAKQPFEPLPSGATRHVQQKEEESASDTLEERYHKLELLLNEKNQMINKLQIQLKNVREDREEFDKIRILMEEQLITLKEQNRMLKMNAEIRPRFHFQDIAES